MRRHRTTARGIVFSLLLAGLIAAAPAAPSSGSARAEQAVPRLVFPLVARTLLWDNFGDPRPNGRHEGIDLENPWRAPVVAVEAGRVEYAASGLGGCTLYLYGRSGTTYMYIHLNNDLTRRNDDRGGCKKDVAFAVPNGARVAAGEQVGFNGDSGDAAGNPHLHFEVHPKDGAAANPYRHLDRAVRPLFAARPGSPFSLGLRGKLLAAGGGSVRLEVSSVRYYPGGRWLAVDPRVVELAVSAERGVTTTIAGVSAPEYRVLAKPLAVTAVTLKAKTTSDAIVGAPGALTAASISPTP
jgi:murein DD-endopeptidase MepM/ murein hydrolase activator NlpD